MDAGASRKYVELSNDAVGISVWIHEGMAVFVGGTSCTHVWEWTFPLLTSPLAQQTCEAESRDACLPLIAHPNCSICSPASERQNAVHLDRGYRRELVRVEE